MFNPLSKPRFTHDCEECKFIGHTFPGDDDEKYDFYVCANSEKGSIIARYGNEGSEYLSMPISIAFYGRCAYLLHKVAKHLAFSGVVKMEVVTDKLNEIAIEEN